MCANCGCQGDKATVLDLQTGDTTTITVLHQHESGTGHSHTPDHDHDGHDQALNTDISKVARMGIQPVNIRIRITRLGMPR